VSPQPSGTRQFIKLQYQQWWNNTVSAMYQPCITPCIGTPMKKIIWPMHFYLQGDAAHLVFGHAALCNSPWYTQCIVSVTLGGFKIAPGPCAGCKSQENNSSWKDSCRPGLLPRKTLQEGRSRSRSRVQNPPTKLRFYWYRRQPWVLSTNPYKPPTQPHVRSRVDKHCIHLATWKKFNLPTNFLLPN
jgi:hypothetical protein